jgi:hypothetical protein
MPLAQQPHPSRIFDKLVRHLTAHETRLLAQITTLVIHYSVAPGKQHNRSPTFTSTSSTGQNGYHFIIAANGTIIMYRLETLSCHAVAANPIRWVSVSGDLTNQASGGLARPRHT